MWWLVLGAGCGEAPVIPDDIGLDEVHAAPEAAAARGEAWLRGETTGTWGFPVLGFQGLGAVRDDGFYDLVELYAALREDYGFLGDPEDPFGPPLGAVVRDGVIQFTCLSCHTDVVAGQVVLGGSSGSVDWEALGADLTTVAGIAGVAAPFSLDGFTAAPGTHDAWGLGFSLSGGPPSVNTDFGYQQSPAWWSRRFKQRLYLDGSGSTDGRRTMAAMYLGYGASLSQIEAMDADLDDAWAAMVRMAVPEWSLTELDPVRWRAGEALFEEHCVACHGRYSGAGDRTFPDQVVDVGTDAERHTQMRQAEVDFLNASWFGEDAPFEDTDGYLAPVLHGVWATAPYLHNGSVPTLWGVLDSSDRPDVWARDPNPSEGYDTDRVGLAVTEYGSAREADEPVFDASAAGLSNEGHTLGDGLGDEERWALLEYLKSL